MTTVPTTARTGPALTAFAEEHGAVRSSGDGGSALAVDALTVPDPVGLLRRSPRDRRRSADAVRAAGSGRVTIASASQLRPHRSSTAVIASETAENPPTIANTQYGAAE